MTPGLALFVKTPGRSPVKSRLWPAIGREAAEALYLDCAASGAAVALALQQAGRLCAYWAVAEADNDSGGGDLGSGIAAPTPWRDLPCLAQGEGGLGQRMATVYDALRTRHGGALLIGTDVPQVPEAALAEACDVLVEARADLVIGPSEDGGFWLVGGTSPVPHSAWTAPRYSSADARQDFLAALPSGLRVYTLATLRDLDEPQDLPAVAAALAALPMRHAAQGRLLRRLDSLLAIMPR